MRLLPMSTAIKDEANWAGMSGSELRSVNERPYSMVILSPHAQVKQRRRRLTMTAGRVD
jgi:hypothetical protein